VFTQKNYRPNIGVQEMTILANELDSFYLTQKSMDKLFENRLARVRSACVSEKEDRLDRLDTAGVVSMIRPFRPLTQAVLTLTFI
jgi:hypothetical protein